MKKILLSTVALISTAFSGVVFAQETKAPAEATPATQENAATPATPAATDAAKAVTPTTTETPTEMKKETTEASANAATAEENKTSASPESLAGSLDLTNTIVLKLKDGAVVIKLLPEVAPNHVARIIELTKQGFYDGVVFHRVIDGFMAQTGDPTGTGRGGSGQKINSEFSNEKHVRGTVSMARAADPNSADSQFFIVFDEAPHLDNNYTVFGQVVSGMEFVDKIKRGNGPNGMVTDPDKVVSMKVAADLPPEELPDVLKTGGAQPATTEGATTPTTGEAPKETDANAKPAEAKAPEAATTTPAANTPPAVPAQVPASMQGKEPVKVAP